MYMKNSIFLMLVILVPFIAFLKRNQIKKKIEYLIEKIKDKESMSSYSIFVAIVVFINLVFYNSTIPNILSGYLYGVYKGTFQTRHPAGLFFTRYYLAVVQIGETLRAIRKIHCYAIQVAVPALD